MKRERPALGHDLALIALSIIISIVLVKTGIIHTTLAKTEGSALLSSFVAGTMFASIFTVTIATTIFAELAQSNALWPVALVGGVGAVLGDLLLFAFVRDRLSVHLAYYIGRWKYYRVMRFMRHRAVRWILPIIGAIIIASPFPDELGLTLMGLSGISTLRFIPISFGLNFLGIIVIGLIARSAG